MAGIADLSRVAVIAGAGDRWLDRIVAVIAENGGHVAGVLVMGGDARLPALMRAYARVDARLRPAAIPNGGQVTSAIPRFSVDVDVDVAKSTFTLVVDPSGLARGREWEFASLATGGLWTWRSGRAGDLAAAAEFVAGDPVADVILAVWGDGEPAIWMQSHPVVDPTSIGRTEANLRTRVIERLGATLAARAAGRPFPGVLVDGQLPNETPGFTSTIRRLAGLGPTYVRGRVAQRTTREEWSLAIREQRPAPVWEDSTGFLMFRPPDDKFWADPFLFRRNGRSHLFFEVCAYGSRHGMIAVSALDDHGHPSEPRVVLEVDHHLAYPHVFEAEGRVWMLPDNDAAAPLELFVAVDYPFRWEFSRELGIPGRFVDPTIVFRDGRWWLFACILPTSATVCDELVLYSAPTLAGPWTPHPANPIVSDARTARGAGRIFYRGERMFRPVQDGSDGYGRRLRFQEILRLDAEVYVERSVGRLDPVWTPGIDGTHTYGEDGVFCVLDGRTPRRRWG